MNANAARRRGPRQVASAPEPFVQVTFHGCDRSDAVERFCWAEAEKLRRFFDGTTSCRVWIEVPHRRHRTGNQRHVRIHLAVPRTELVVDREPAARQRDVDLDVALRDAFDRARRLLEDHVRKLRGQTKRHAGTAVGRITRVMPIRGYGFLEDEQGREIYFHRNAVHGDAFEQLELGQEVRFHEEPGLEGPQASAVRSLHRRNGRTP